MNGQRWFGGFLLGGLSCAGILGLIACERMSEHSQAGLSLVQVTSLIPPSVRQNNRDRWGQAIHAAMTRLQTTGVRYTVGGTCAVIAVIGQESSFQENTPIPGLAKIIRTKLQDKATSLIPYAGPWVMNYVLDLPLLSQKTTQSVDLPESPAHLLQKQSIGQRLDQVKTENDLVRLLLDIGEHYHLPNWVVQEMIDRKVVKTVGPMQISAQYAIAFGQKVLNQTPWQTRAQLKTLEGAVLFGAAHLLHYQHQYKDWRYVFADYNAGHYASRNAAWQKALAQLSGKPVSMDGDLLRHDRSGPPPSQAQSALKQLKQLKQLPTHVTEVMVAQDLAQEKSAGFEQTTTYLTVVQAYEKQFGSLPNYAVLPNIDLKSPKITRQLTTAWFANRVYARQQSCLKAARKQGLVK